MEVVNDLVRFMGELGVQPKRIRCGTVKYVGILQEVLTREVTTNLYTATRDMKLIPDRVKPRSVHLNGVPVEEDAKLEPAAFEFDMEAA